MYGNSGAIPLTPEETLENLGILNRSTIAELLENLGILNRSTLKDEIFSNLVISDKTLKGTKFTNSRLEKPVFENVTFEDAVFDEIDMRNVNFKNVIFKNCTFINTHMREGIFTDVLFTGGSFSYHKSYRNDPYPYSNPNRSYIKRIYFSNVVFDSVETDRFCIEAIEGSITLKNIRRTKDNGIFGPLIVGSKVTLRADNCEINGALAVLSKDSSAYITNSTLITSGIVGAEVNTVYYENCELLDGVVTMSSKTVVVKNSRVCGVFRGEGTWYFESSDFIQNSTKPNFFTEFIGKKESRFFILGNNNEAYIDMEGGTIYAYDLILKQPRLYNIFPVKTINLRNVTIRGGKLRNFKMDGGQWENVKIYPEVIVYLENNLGNLKMHNVTFPDGNPLSGIDKITIAGVTSDTLFTWPEVHIPTPEELGLAREFPPITGAPQGK